MTQNTGNTETTHDTNALVSQLSMMLLNVLLYAFDGLEVLYSFHMQLYNSASERGWRAPSKSV